MKTIEEKAKAYDEAMNKLRTMRDAWNNLETDYSPKDVVHDIEYYFPELKESGDEKIRKRIIERLKSMEVGSPTEIGEEVAWLEKQSEQTSAKVEPKFKVGDWVVVDDGRTGRIIECTQDFADVDLEFSILSTRVNNIRSWTIQDAKDGDVLVHSSFMFDDFIFIYNTTSILQAYCYYTSEKKRFIIEDGGHYCPWNMQEVKPATKEQRDTLIKSMTEAGYGWDAEKKKLKKIEQKSSDSPKGEDYGIDGLYNAIRILEKTLGKVDGYQTDDGILEHECAISAVKRLYEQKPWSEEDEEMATNIVEALSAYADKMQYEGFCHNSEVLNEQITWFKSLKNRVLPQPKQEWSEEDENWLINAINVCELHNYNETADWLKSLRPQSQWKPSDEQMYALKFASEGTDVNLGILKSLHQDLKKLKGK